MSTPATPPAAPASPAVTDTNSTQKQHLKEITGSLQWRIPTAVITVIGIGAGVATQPVAAIGALVGVPIVALVIAYFIADSRAKKDFWAAFAKSLGMTYVGSTELPHVTSILMEGDRRSCTDWMTGTENGRDIGLGNFTYQVREQDSDGDGYHYVDHDFTMALIDVAAEDACFVQDVSIRGNRRNKLTRWFANESVGGELVNTESAAFDDRYDLMVGKTTNQVRVLEIFTPSFLDRLSTHPLNPMFDYTSGTLVVFEKGHSSTAADFTAMLECAREIAKRIQEEIDESLKAGQSVAPTA